LQQQLQEGTKYKTLLLLEALSKKLFVIVQFILIINYKINYLSSIIEVVV
jgi:hypothetical protein